MPAYAVGGVEKVEFAPAFFEEADLAAATWTEVENIAPDTVVYTKNSDTETDLIPEDKDVAFVTFYAPGEADTLALGLLEQKPEVLELLQYEEYDPATTTSVVLAKRKVANLAVRLTTRNMKDGRKQIIVLPNIRFVTTTVNNLSKTALQQLLLTGKVGSFKTTTSRKDAISIKKWVTEDGTAIDSTPATPPVTP